MENLHILTLSLYDMCSFLTEPRSFFGVDRTCQELENDAKL